MREDSARFFYTGAASRVVAAQDMQRIDVDRQS